MDNLNLTWTHAIAAATVAVGYLVSFIPTLAKYQQILIIGGAVIIAAVILIADAVKSRPAGQSVGTATEDQIKSVVSQIDLTPAVHVALAKIISGAPVANPPSETPTVPTAVQ